MSNYEKVWKQMDDIDIIHAEKKKEWQFRELEKIIVSLNQFHFSTKPLNSHLLYHNRISESITKFEATQEFDYMFVDSLKDAIHNIWIDVNIQKELSEEESEDQKIPNFKEIFSEVEDIEFFKKFSFRELYYGHTKEGKDREIEEQEYFFLDFFRLYDKKNKTNFLDAFSFMLHDFFQEIRGTQYNVEYMKEFVEAYEKMLITEKCFMYLMKLSQKIIVLRLQHGAWTHEVDKLEEEIRPFHHLMHDMLSDKREFNWEVRCDGTSNCDKKIKLTKREISDMQKGKGLKRHACLAHQTFNEYGRNTSYKTLDYYFYRLPKCPVLLRWVAIDESWNKKRGMVDKLENFMKENKGIRIKEFKLEPHFNSDGTRDESGVHYVEITNDKTLYKFTKFFKDDFIYGHTVEIVPKE